MSPRTKQQFEDIREEKKRLILDTALKHFANKGYHITSISMIAKEAGISKGLLYNYFESKESLLISLIEEFTSMLGSLMNPNNDDEISNQEMEEFLILMTESMSKQNELWKLYFQLSMQSDVIEIIKQKLNSAESLVKYSSLMFKFFAERFENPIQEMLFFSSLIKWYCLQYVLAPETFPETELKPFLERIKRMIIVDKLPLSKQKKSSEDLTSLM